MSEINDVLHVTNIPLRGALEVGELSLILANYDLRERIVFTYPDGIQPAVTNERFRRLASGLIRYDTQLQLIEVCNPVRIQVAPTRLENSLFDALTAKENTVLKREYLFKKYFNRNDFDGIHVVDVHLSNLRKRLGPAGGYIKTRRSVGFYADGDFELPA